MWPCFFFHILREISPKSWFISEWLWERAMEFFRHQNNKEKIVKLYLKIKRYLSEESKIFLFDLNSTNNQTSPFTKNLNFHSNIRLFARKRINLFSWILLWKIYFLYFLFQPIAHISPSPSFSFIFLKISFSRYNFQFSPRHIFSKNPNQIKLFPLFPNPNTK